MYRIHRSIDISFAHHVRGHWGPCVNVHGHTWKFEVGAKAATLDGEGFVVDFGRIKSEVLEPCHRLLDHAFAVGASTFSETESALTALGTQLISSREKVHGRAKPAECPPLELHGAKLSYPGGMKVAVFPFSPTSERLAQWLYGLSETQLSDHRVKIDFARIYETLHPVESVAEFRSEV